MADSILYKKLGIAYGVFWLFWVELHVFVLHRLGFSWHVAVADSLINNSLLAAACFGVGSVLRWYTPDKKTGYKILIWLFVLAFICAKLTNIILLYIFSEEINYASILNKTVLIRFGIALLIITWTAAIRWIFNNARQQKKMKNEKLRQKNYRARLNSQACTNSYNPIFCLTASIL